MDTFIFSYGKIISVEFSSLPNNVASDINGVGKKGNIDISEI